MVVVAAGAAVFVADSVAAAFQSEETTKLEKAPGNLYDIDQTRTLPGLPMPDQQGRTFPTPDMQGPRQGEVVITIGGHDDGPAMTPPIVGELETTPFELMPFMSSDRIYPVRPDEVIAIDMAPEFRVRAQKRGFQFLRSRRLDAVGLSVDVIQPPDGMSLSRALKRLRKADPDGKYEPNPIFAGMGRVSELPDGLTPGGGAVRIGIVDTGFDDTKSVFALTKITQRNFGRGAVSTPRNHGAHVAALAVRSGAGELLVADAFSGDGEFADAEALARSLDWLATESVPIINMSVAGPPSELLQLAVERLIARGHVIVAAVGNDGPETPPQYPAAYPYVVGVTAVDRALQMYERANRGPGVDIASIGVDLVPSELGESAVSGTSFAAPAVAAFLAEKFDRLVPGAARISEALIKQRAVDLGAPGKDPVYGVGYLAPDQSLAQN
jgi:hypothetical protein